MTQGRRALGKTGIDVQPIGLGCMGMSLAGRPDEDTSVRVIHAALEVGMDFLDTADVYCMADPDIGHNERLIARALKEWGSGAAAITVATKGGLERPEGDWTVNGRPKHLRQACEKSLRALGVDCITVYQLHAPDPDVPFADSVGELSRFQEEGKVQHVGLSNVSVAQIEEAMEIVPIVSVQNRCSAFERAAWEEGVVSHCETEGIAFLAYSPVGGRYGKDRIVDHPTLNEVATGHGVTPFQVALAWLLEESPAIIPIPGPSKLRNALDCAVAMRLELTRDDMEQMREAFPLP